MTTDWAKPFPITSLYRYDLQRIGCPNEQTDTLTDMDMLKIAQKMQVLYLQSAFWKHLESAVAGGFCLGCAGKRTHCPTSLYVQPW
jgi:hypothetical protein